MAITKGTLLLGLLGVLVLADAWVLAEIRPGDAKNGRQVYERRCLRCHGTALDGKGPDAGSLKVPPADFHTTLSRMKDDFELQLVIRRGRMSTAMHRWDTTFTEQQIRDVVAYIRSVAPKIKP